MCLITVETRGNFNIGYKIFDISNDGLLYFPWYHPKKLNSLRINKWIHDKSKGLLNKYGLANNKYRTGFHIFTTEHDAKEFASRNDVSNAKVIRKVYYKNIVAIGSQVEQVVVARSIKILPSVD